MKQRCPRIRCSKSSAALWSLCLAGCVLTVAISSTAIENAIQIVICTGLTRIATTSLARSEARSDEMIDAAVAAALKMATAWTACQVIAAPETAGLTGREESLAQVVILPRSRGAAHARRRRA